MNIGFWGVGNMGGALIKGYAKEHKESNLFAYDLDKVKLDELSQNYGVHSCPNLETLVAESDLIIIALKPNLFDKILAQLSPILDGKTVVSIAAGISINFIESYLGEDSKIIRVMPNTSAMINMGMTALAANKNISDKSLQEVTEIFSSVGKVVKVKEEDMHAVIGISGSSPAYTYMYIEALIEGGVQNGLNREDAKLMAAQAVLGAAQMVMVSQDEPETLRDNVCSPNGTTIEAVHKLQENGFQEKLIEGMEAAIARSKEISK